MRSSLTSAGASWQMTSPLPEGCVPWRSLLSEATTRLREAGVEQPDLEARRIVERASGTEGAEYVIALDAPATNRGVHFFDVMVERRSAGEPLQYVLGRWAFRTLDLLVDGRVLIPRPETEVVAGHALDELDRLTTHTHDRRRLTAVDLGTGSGAIALSIAAERTHVDVWGTDVSTDALEVARANLAGIGPGATRVRLVEGSWFEALSDELRGGVDLFVSNPPYVAEGADLPAEVAEWEPAQALVSGPTGLEGLIHIVTGASAWLRRPGVLVLELAPGQSGSVRKAARDSGFDEVAVFDDLADRERVLVARLLR